MLNLIDDTNDQQEINLLLTLDLEALYTNIPQDATIEVIEACLRAQIWTTAALIDFIIECATIA